MLSGQHPTPIPDTLADKIGHLPGVRAVETVRAVTGQIFRAQRIGLLALSDGFFGASGYPPRWYHEGDPATAAPAIREGRGVNVSNALSDRFDVHVNDVIALDTPTGSVQVAVVGVVPDFISDRGSVILGKRFLADYWGERTATRINVFLRPGASLEDVRRHIETALGGMLSAFPPAPGRYESCEYLGYQDFRAVLEKGSRLFWQAGRTVLDAAGAELNDCKFVLTHQATGKMHGHAAKLGVPTGSSPPTSRASGIPSAPRSAFSWTSCINASTSRSAIVCCSSSPRARAGATAVCSSPGTARG
jgi:hypothetical protein